jgi:hypothetical protein
MTSADLTQGQSPLVLVSFFPNKKPGDVQKFISSTLSLSTLTCLNTIPFEAFNYYPGSSAPENSTQKAVFIRHYMYLV